MTNTVQQLQSFHIIQRNPNNEVAIIWTFPNISTEHKNVVLKKVFTLQEKNAFNCTRLNDWLYIREFELEGRQLAICLITTDYDPNKYEMLCNILIKRYQKTENPVELVKLYLSVFTQGSLSVQENGTLVTHDFKRFNSITNVREMIKAFGLEIILIYNALLLKKRMLVYHQNLRKLQKALFSISKIMLHRNPNDYLYPHVDDMLDARAKSFFLAGTINSKPPLNSDFYDLFINLSSLQISISSHAKEIFAMNKTHKELATFIVQLADNSETSEQQIIQGINSKTQELLTNLKSLASVKISEDKRLISLETLRAKRLNPITENFLFNLAVAENIMML